MHDQYTLAFEFRLFRRRFVTIWHVDPEHDGSDDSCDWFNRGKLLNAKCPKRQAVHEAIWGLESILDNRPYYPDSIEHRRFQVLKKAIRDLMRPKDRWWFQHPKWHFWHWKIDIHALSWLRRKLFMRCELCGKKFRRGEAVISNCWTQPKRRWFEWFRSPRGVRHEGQCCRRSEVANEGN